MAYIEKIDNVVEPYVVKVYLTKRELGTVGWALRWHAKAAERFGTPASYRAAELAKMFTDMYNNQD